MASVTVRIEKASHKVLRDLSKHTGRPMQAVLAKAIEEYRRKEFLDKANMAFAALRRDRAAWKRELEERAAWEATLSDAQQSD